MIGKQRGFSVRPHTTPPNVTVRFILHEPYVQYLLNEVVASRTCYFGEHRMNLDDWRLVRLSLRGDISSHLKEWPI